MRRLWFPVLMGVVGVAVLLGLGVWQLQRMAWKEAILSEIAARLAAAPMTLPVAPDPASDRYLPVIVTGALSGEEAHVLVSLPGEGPGYRVIAALTTGDRRILADLGFVPDADKSLGRMAETVTIAGNLHWPDETDGYTPAPDLARAIWFARDVPAMAEALGTEPVLVVARSIEGADLGTIPLPVDPSGVPNDHWEYAVTWFSLALVWAAMSAVLIRRTAAMPA